MTWLQLTTPSSDRTKWYGQYGTDKMVSISTDSNSTELNFLFSNQLSQISDMPKWVYVEAGLVKKIILSVEAGLLD